MLPLPDDPSRKAQQFGSTHWSVVLLARDRDASRAREALTTLCQTYWYPLYAFIRRQGESDDSARDLTQEFFTYLLEKDVLRTVDRDKGKFRTFLLACCRHFLSNQRDRAQAQKRGGGQNPIPLDLSDAEDRYRLEPAHTLTPEKLFDRRWALDLLDRALEHLQEECQREGKEVLYTHLKLVLVGGVEALAYAQIGEAVGMTEAAVKKAAQRLRQRFREVVREQIGATVESEEQIEDEVRTLFNALSW